MNTFIDSELQHIAILHFFPDNQNLLKSKLINLNFLYMSVAQAWMKILMELSIDFSSFHWSFDCFYVVLELIGGTF